MDLEQAIRDSLQRQITEAKKQLKSLSKQNLQKELELSRKLEEAKAKVLINFCKFKKEVQDTKSKVQDFQSECKFDFQNREQLILHSNRELIKWKYSRIEIFEEISELLKSNLPFRPQLVLDDYNEEETTARIIEELQIENLDLAQSNARSLFNLVRLESIRREIVNYLKGLVQGNGFDCFEIEKKNKNKNKNLDDRNRDLSSATCIDKAGNRATDKFNPSDSLASLASFVSLAGFNSLASSQSLSSENVEEMQEFRDLKEKKVRCCDKIFKCFRKKR